MNRYSLVEALSRLAIIVASVVFAVLLAEAALRLTIFKQVLRPSYGFPPYMFETSAISGFDLAAGFRQGTHAFVDAEYEVFTNDLGCFDKNTMADFRTHPYILLVGGSFTWGYAPYEFKWGTLLERMLEPQFKVAKCGVPGYGARQELNKAHEVIRRIGRPPDAIVLDYARHYPTDDLLFTYYDVRSGQRVSRFKTIDLKTGAVARLSDNELDAGIASALAQETGLFAWIRQHSITWNLLRRVFRIYFPQPTASVDVTALDADRHPWVSELLRKHVAALAEFKSMCERSHIALFLLEVGSSAEVQAPPSVFMSRIEELGIPSIKMRDEFLRLSGSEYAKKFYWKFDGHWNTSGNEAAAIAVTRTLIARQIASPLSAEGRQLENRLLADVAR